MCLTLLGGLVWLAFQTGSPRLSLLAAGLGALVVSELLLGSLNLRGLTIERRIEGEVFAQLLVQGHWGLRNQRKWGSAWCVSISEVNSLGSTGVGDERVMRLRSGERKEVPAGWRFLARGQQSLQGVMFESRWPFGMVRRRRYFHVPQQVLVYPAIGGHAPTIEVAGPRLRRVAPKGLGAQEGYEGLREYVPGDPLRWIHWPTSARTQTPMVIQRPDLRSDQLMVEVRAHPRMHWEEVLSNACSEIIRGLGRGMAVGLVMQDERHPPRRGSAWRRHLLSQLALASLPEEEGA